MKKNILIPVDFNIESLNTLKLAIQANTAHEIRVVLMYPGALSSSFTDLLFYSEREIIKSLMQPEFEQALAVIKNCYETKLKSMELKLLTSNNLMAMNYFLDSNAIDEIFLPKSYVLRAGRGGFNPIPLLKKSGIPFYELDWQPLQKANNH